MYNARVWLNAAQLLSTLALAGERTMQNIPRLASIDYFRGFAGLLMVVAAFLFGTEALPARLRHAPDCSKMLIAAQKG